MRECLAAAVCAARFFRGRWRWPVAAAGLLAVHADAADPVRLSISTREAHLDQSIPARLHLLGADGKAVHPTNGLPFWYDHFVSPGQAALDVSPGRYLLTVERGPEWSRESLALDLPNGLRATNVVIRLKRVANLPAEGWWPGETHIHRPIEQAELLMRAEDLHFAQVITWWNARSPWTTTPLPAALPARFDGDRFYHALGGEDERDGGALLFFNLKQPVDITAGQQHHPSSLAYARQARDAGAWIDIEKPFWWDVPMWIAQGIGDSIGIAHNHMHRGGVYEGEAWGRPRDQSLFPAPQGNGWWTQTIYYHLLNCGIRIPPSAGSASGVLPNPVGYDRMYVHLEGEPTWEKWFAGWRAGRVFVSNGPLLRVKVNGQLPGHVFREKRTALELRLEGRLDSTDSIERVELVRNGRVEKISLPGRINIAESGWFLVRAVTTLTNTLRFASTGPFYVELKGEAARPQQRESAKFFVTWCDERLETLAGNSTLSAAQKEDLFQPWREARAFWQAKLEAATPARE